MRNREAVNILLKQEALVDLIIPRGGEGLIRHVVVHSSIPVLKHYKGVCHAYVDDTADSGGARGAGYGPMGIRELTTTKFVAWGSGQIRN